MRVFTHALTLDVTWMCMHALHVTVKKPISSPQMRNIKPQKDLKMLCCKRV